MAAAEADKPQEEPDPFAISDDEVRAVISEAKGNAFEAIRMLIRDLAIMSVDAEAAVSKGLFRGRYSAGARRPRAW